MFLDIETIKVIHSDRNLRDLAQVPAGSVFFPHFCSALRQKCYSFAIYHTTGTLLFRTFSEAEGRKEALHRLSQES